MLLLAGPRTRLLSVTTGGSHFTTVLPPVVYTTVSFGHVRTGSVSSVKEICLVVSFFCSTVYILVYGDLEFGSMLTSYYSTESKFSVVSDGQQRKQGFMAPLSQCDLISQRGTERDFLEGGEFTFSRWQCS